MTPHKKTLPISLSSFRTIRKEEGYYYVDKTSYIHKLLVGETHKSAVFLSRPRRFGKTLLLDTLAELFKGSQDLFEGLYIYDKWNWEETFPVIQLDLSGAYQTPEEFNLEVNSRLYKIARHLGITLPQYDSKMNAGFLFLLLVEEIVFKTGKQCVVLIDEYDSPFATFWGSEEELRKTQEIVRGLFTSIKKVSNHLRFTMITGVTKLDQIQLFSAINHLRDISLLPWFNAICGYTEEELVSTFHDLLVEDPKSPDITLENLRYWYNGYNWLGFETVYNPYDILYALEERVTLGHWYELGTPTLLYEILEEMESSEWFDLPTYSVTQNYLRQTISLGTTKEVDKLLFQTGYLTNKTPIDEYRSADNVYRLDFPNNEVKSAFARLQLAHKHKSRQFANNFCNAIFDAINRLDFKAFEKELQSNFAKLNYYQLSDKRNKRNNRKNDSSSENERLFSEAEFSRLMYVSLRAADFKYVEAEVATTKGRLDMLLVHKDHFFIFEFKGFKAKDVCAEKVGEVGLQQIADKAYAAPFRNDGPVFHIAVDFCREDLQLIGISVQSAAQEEIPQLAEGETRHWK